MTGAQAVECPGPLTLFQYANGHLDRTQSERIASHVRTCSRCAEKVQATGNDGRSLADALEPREPMALETAEDVLRRLDLDLEFVDDADVEVAPAKSRAATVAPSARPTLPPPGGLRSRGLPPPPVRKPTPMGSSLRSDPPPSRATVGPPPSFGRPSGAEGAAGGTKVAPAPQAPTSSGDNTVRAPAPARPASPPSKPTAAAPPPVPVVRTTGSGDSKSAPVVDATRSSRKWLYASIVVFALLGVGAAGALILYPRLTGEELRWASVVAVFDKNAETTTKASDAPSQPEDEDKVDAKKVDAKAEDAKVEDDAKNVDDAKVEDDAKAEDAKAIDAPPIDDAPPAEGDAKLVDAKEQAPPPEETKAVVEEAAPPAPEAEAKPPAEEAAEKPEPAADDTKLAAAKIDAPAEKPAEPPPAEPPPAEAEEAAEKPEAAAPPKPAIEPTPVAPARTPLYSEPVGSRDPGEAADLAKRGALALRKSDVTAAEAMFLRALAHDPRNATALGGLAALHFGQGRHRTALKFAAKAVNAAPQDADLRILLGDAYLETLGYANARREYEKAGALGHRGATARLARLQERLAAK